MNAKDGADFDQASADLADFFPPMLFSLHRGLVKEGFSREESFRLVETFFSQWLRRIYRPEN